MQTTQVMFGVMPLEMLFRKKQKTTQQFYRKLKKMTDKLKGFLELIIGNFVKKNISERSTQFQIYCLLL